MGAVLVAVVFAAIAALTVVSEARTLVWVASETVAVLLVVVAVAAAVESVPLFPLVPRAPTRAPFEVVPA